MEGRKQLHKVELFNIVILQAFVKPLLTDEAKFPHTTIIVNSCAEEHGSERNFAHFVRFN